MRKHRNSDRLYFGRLQNHCRWWVQPWNEKMLTPWKESYDQPRQHIKKQRHYFANEGLSHQGYGFSRIHVWMCQLDYNESLVPKNWCFWTVVLEKTLASPLDCKEIQPAHPRGDQSCVFIERADAEAETPNTLTTWWEELIWKDPDAGKDWRQEEKRVTEHETVGWIEIWVSSGSWCWTGKPGVLQYMGSQSETWLNNWTERYAAYLFVLGTLSVLFPVP